MSASELIRGDQREGFHPRQARRRLILITLVAVDFSMAALAGFGATLLRFGTDDVPVILAGINTRTDYHTLALALAFMLPLFLTVEHLYDLESLFWGSGEFSRVAHASTLAIVTVMIGAYIFRIDNFSRLWLLYTWILVALLLAAGRWSFRRGLRAVRRRRRLLRPTLIVGCNTDAERMAVSLGIDYASGLAPVGCLASHAHEAFEGASLIPGVPIIGHAGQLVEKVDESGCDAVVIVSSAFEHSTVSSIVSQLRRLPIDVHVSSGLFDVLTARVLVRELAGTPIMLVRGTSLSVHKMRMKRSFDIIFSSLVLILGMPLWIAIAAAIKLDSRGPIFYRQQRVGRAGAEFGMYKFRSMYVDAETRLHQLKQTNDADGPLFKMRNDPRVTSVGRYLRKYSLDEFPQLLNVLVGQMSVVGPRPPLPSEAEQYTAHHSRRLEVAPGMTGLWQVSGRSDLTFDEMIRLDLFYIENWSLRYDLALVARTIPSVLFADGAY